MARFERGALVAQTSAITKLSYIPVWLAGLEPAASCSQSRRAAYCAIASQSGCPDLNWGPHAPEACALPSCATTRSRGPPRIRTENLLLAGESLCQLELAAHEGAPADGGTRQTSQAVSGLTPFRPGQPASFMVFRCADVKYSQARSPRRAVLRRDGRI